MKRFALAGLAVLAMVFAGAVMVQAQDEEGNAAAAGEEQPAETQETAEAPGQALDEAAVKEAVLGYITTDTRLKGGHFLLFDTVMNRAWRLKDPKPAGKARSQGPDASVVCVKMTSGVGNDRKTLDVDFFVGKGETGGLVVNDIKIHKVSNVERFTYDENNQIKVPAKRTVKKTVKKAAPGPAPKTPR